MFEGNVYAFDRGKSVHLHSHSASAVCSPCGEIFYQLLTWSIR